MITRPVIRSVIRQTIRSAIAGLVQRFFSTLDGLSTYYTMPTWTATGDFEIEFEFSTTDKSSQKTIMSGNAGASYIAIPSDTSIVVRMGGTFNSFVVGVDIRDGRLHKGVASKVGSFTHLIFDGVAQTPLANAGATDAIDFIGQFTPSGQLFSGVLANIGLTDTAGGDNRFYPLDSSQYGPGAIEVNALNPGTNDLQKINFVAGDIEKFTLNTAADPDQWENSDKTRIIQVAS